MTPAEETRLAVLETEVKGVRGDIADVKVCISDLSAKVDKALIDKTDWTAHDALVAKVDTKAEASELSGLRSLIIGLLISTAGAALLLLIGIVLFVVEGHISF